MKNFVKPFRLPAAIDRTDLWLGQPLVGDNVLQLGIDIPPFPHPGGRQKAIPAELPQIRAVLVSGGLPDVQ